jgi:molybdopterin biosynthesis enzyme
MKIDVIMPSNCEQILTEVCKEYIRSAEKHVPFFRSPHEGYAVIKEELEEIWDEIKADDIESQRKEAIQLCAMALKFLLSDYKKSVLYK